MIGVGEGVVGFGVGGDGVEHFLEADGGEAVVLVDDADLEVFEVAAEGIAEDDELGEGHDDGDHDEGGAAAEAAEVAFDDGPDSVHQLIPVSEHINDEGRNDK